jgi:hypothetical protein
MHFPLADVADGVFVRLQSRAYNLLDQLVIDSDKIARLGIERDRKTGNSE